VDLDQIKTFVRSSSKGLAEVTPTTSEVQFIHESVRDFLLGKYGGQWSNSDNFVGHSHEVLKNCCMAQLNASIARNADVFDPLRPAWEEIFLKSPKEDSVEFPFLSYAVGNVL